MSRMYHIIDEDFNERSFEGNDKMLEKAFEEGCRHGYKKAMREVEGGFNERGGMGYRTNYREGFEEKLEKLKRKFG